MPETYECYLSWIKDLCRCDETRIQWWGSYPALSEGWPIPVERPWEQNRSFSEAVVRTWWLRLERCSHKSRKASSCLKLEETRNGFSSRASAGSATLLSPGLWTSGLQKCENKILLFQMTKFVVIFLQQPLESSTRGLSSILLWNGPMSEACIDQKMIWGLRQVGKQAQWHLG